MKSEFYDLYKVKNAKISLLPVYFEYVSYYILVFLLVYLAVWKIFWFALVYN